MKEVKIGRSVGIPAVGLKSVRMPIVGNRSDFVSGDFKMLKDLKSHMLGWYDPKLQGCTNESLTKNPVLNDLSGNNHPLELKNFTFGGLRGMGSYGTNLTKWVGAEGSIISYINKKPNVLEVSFTEKANRYNINAVRLDYNGVATNTYFKAKLNFDGYFEMYLKLEGVAKNKILSFKKDEIVEVYEEHLLSIRFIPADIINGVSTVETIYKLEILPSYSNSLVFNGTTPTWVYDKSNLRCADASKYTWLSNNKLHINSSTFVIYYAQNGNIGENLNVNIPSYMIRINGMPSELKLRRYIIFYDENGWKYSQDNIYFLENSTYIIEDYSKELIAKPDYTCKFYTYFQLFDKDNITPQEYPVDITLEFLPNYPAPTTKEFGQITTIPSNSVKCMMMDFVPLAGQDYESWYYCQRQNGGNNFAIINASVSDNITDISKIKAYSSRNENGTYINGTVNTDKSVLQLMQQRQVVSVNTNKPQHNNIYLRWDANYERNVPQMALNSLILFDKELTEEEMKFVMKKFMKYEPDDYMKSLMQNTPTSSLAMDDEDFEELVDGWRFSNEDDNEYDNTEDSDIDS